MDSFSGASPFDIAHLFATGALTREQAIEELGRWPYRSGSVSDGYDWTTADEGEFSEIGRAMTEGLIDDEMYDEILHRYSKQEDDSQR
ncbi:hypothetical protein MT355_20970 [Rathayibacter sp. VKM Ac-2929]|uniref:hypothetical protein n=1 Tax=Rathayibacter sp. VKM Ac-2929 TaxID=2929480 RepID=UPI001FB437FB|nr:hypothetical protein [Rathayibacter sp. VKM Ac-2929]MCJ1675748.1 hypothetical protein [Rathayibacter sp. VKM Ac-2929]